MRISLNDAAGPAGEARTETEGAPPALSALSQLPDGEVCAADATIGGEPESLLLHRDGDDVRAWLNVCPHAGRRLDWSPGKFLRTRDGGLVCAVHGATFELGAGECVSGPCRGEHLRAVPIVVRDGAVWLASEE